MMKSALVAIAKNEDEYINEWINYNLKIGFDNIIIFQNNWRAKIHEQYKDKVILIEFDTDNKFAQCIAYNKAIDLFHTKYDFIAFFDIDEFLVIKNNTVNMWLTQYMDYDAVGINWKYFGDAGLQKVENNDYSITRFTKSQIGLNNHIKTIINTKKTGDSNKLHICCHCTSKSFSSDSTISVDGINFIRGYENTKNLDMCENIAYLAHFRCKTFDEWNIKCDRNGTGIQRDMNEYKPQVRFKHFQEFNMNEIYNVDVKDILFGVVNNN